MTIGGDTLEHKMTYCYLVELTLISIILLLVKNRALRTLANQIHFYISLRYIPTIILLILRIQVVGWGVSAIEGFGNKHHSFSIKH